MTISLVKKNANAPEAYGDPQFRFDEKNCSSKNSMIRIYCSGGIRPTEFHFHSGLNAMAETNE